MLGLLALVLLVTTVLLVWVYSRDLIMATLGASMRRWVLNRREMVEETILWQGVRWELVLVHRGLLRVVVLRRVVMDVEAQVPLTPGLTRFREA
jgi:hypothetical protein